MRPKDLSGKRFGKLIAIEQAGKAPDGHIIWKCICDCGKTITSISTYLTRGNKKSCGCLLSDKRKDLTNQRFGRLLALKDVGTIPNGRKHHIRLWECLCDCGNITIKRSSQLLQMRVNSCGCLVSDKSRERVKLPDGVSGLNSLFGHYVGSAKRRNISFELTKEQFKELTSQNCFYCGTPPQQEHRAQNREGYAPYIYNGIDRYINKEGYTLSNCVACCMLCNYFKHNLDADLFYQHIKKIYDYQCNAKRSK